MTWCRHRKWGHMNNFDDDIDDLDEDDGRQLSQRLGVATVNACGVVAITLVLEADAMDGLGGLRIDTQ